MSSISVTHAEPCALGGDAHAENASCANVTLNTRIGDANAHAEIWRPVPGFEDWVDVSNLGRGRRWYALVGQRRSSIVKLREPVLLTFRPGPWGRAILPLRREDTRATTLLHRAVLTAFVGPCPEGAEACHFPDRDPMNCALWNLRWDTRASNCADVKAHKSCSAEVVLARLLELRQHHQHLRGDVDGLSFEPFGRELRQATEAA